MSPGQLSSRRLHSLVYLCSHDEVLIEQSGQEHGAQGTIHCVWFRSPEMACDHWLFQNRSCEVWLLRCRGTCRSSMGFCLEAMWMKLTPTAFHPLIVASTDVLLGFLLIRHWRWPGERGKGQNKCIQSSIYGTISIAPLCGWLQEMNDVECCVFSGCYTPSPWTKEAWFTSVSW